MLEGKGEAKQKKIQNNRANFLGSSIFFYLFTIKHTYKQVKTI